MADDPTFRLPKELIQPAIDAHINAAILEAMDGKDRLVSQAVLSVIQTRVDSEGKPSRYSGRGDKPWIDWVIGESLKKATTNAIEGHVEKYKGDIEAYLVAELSKKNSPLMRQLARSMVEGLAESTKSRYSFTVSVNAKD